MKEATAAYLGIGAFFLAGATIGVWTSINVLGQGRPFWYAVFAGAFNDLSPTIDN